VCERYADVDAETPDATPARSAAVHSRVIAGSSAIAEGRHQNNIAPAIALVPTAPSYRTSRSTGREQHGQAPSYEVERPQPLAVSTI